MPQIGDYNEIMSGRKEEAFNSKLYLGLQVSAIKERIRLNRAERVYIEFGGKIFDDLHAARVLPGYWPDMKFRILQKFFKDAEIIFVISAKDILRKRVRGDHKIPYDSESLRVLAHMKKRGVFVKNVVITRVQKEKQLLKPILNFKNRLEKSGFKVFFLEENFNHINPQKDWGVFSNNDFVTTSKKYVTILSPGGGSGKFGVCLNQLFHEMKQGIKPFYIKFETFPVYNLPVTHPVNLAYMAASADFYDLVMKDPRKKNASSYNRDVENYELLHSLARYFKKEGILLRNINSATNMGINAISKSVSDWEHVEKEAAAEIGRRLVRYKYEVKKGEEDKKVLARVRNIVSLL